MAEDTNQEDDPVEDEGAGEGAGEPLLVGIFQRASASATAVGHLSGGHDQNNRCGEADCDVSQVGRSEPEGGLVVLSSYVHGCNHVAPHVTPAYRTFRSPPYREGFQQVGR